MIEPLTKLGITYYQSVRELERLCARQQETIQRQAARLQRTRAEKRAVSAEIQRLQALILSVVTTLKLQRRPVFEFLVQAWEAKVRGSTPPSVCPTT